MNGDIIQALTGYWPLVLCEAVLGAAACVLFLGGTWRGGRSLWAGAALVSLGLAAVALAYTTATCRTVEAVAEENARIEYKLRDAEEKLSDAEAKATLEKRYAEQSAQLHADVYASPVSNSRLALFLKVLALAAARPGADELERSPRQPGRRVPRLHSADDGRPMFNRSGE